MVIERKTSTRRTIIVVGFLVALAALLSALNLRVSQASVRPEAAPVAQAAGGPASTGIVQFTDGTKVSYPSAITLAVDTEATLRAVWVDGGDLHTSISSDSGATWSPAESPEGEPWTGPHDWVGARLHRAYDGSKTWMMAKSADHQYLYASEDDGETWSEQGLMLADRSELAPADMWYGTDDKLWVVSTDFSQVASPKIVVLVSTDQGRSWSAPDAIASVAPGDYLYSPSVVEASTGAVIAVWKRRTSGLVSRITTDSGATWSSETKIPAAYGSYHHPSLGIATDGTLWLAATDTDDRDVSIWRSTDDGESWEGPSRFTWLSGSDSEPDWTPLDGTDMGLVWLSRRSGRYQGWFGAPGIRDDTNGSPYIYFTEHWPLNKITPTTVVTFGALAASSADLETVDLLCVFDGSAQPPFVMFDDDTHGDQRAGDNHYTVQIASLPGNTHVYCHGRASDTHGHQYICPKLEQILTLPELKNTWLAYW